MLGLRIFMTLAFTLSKQGFLYVTLLFITLVKSVSAPLATLFALSLPCASLTHVVRIQYDSNYNGEKKAGCARIGFSQCTRP